MATTTTLVLTSAEDTTADMVADALTVRGGRIARIDVADFPISLSVTSRIGPDGVWRGEMASTDGTAVDLGSICAVYYRRPTRFQFPDHLSPADRRFAEAEARRGLGGLLNSLPARWVSHPARIADAEAKPAQLRLWSTSHCPQASSANRMACARFTPLAWKPPTLTTG